MKKLIGFSLLALPGLVSAQNVTDANSLVDKINSILNAVIPILISFAVVYIIYAVVRYVIASTDEGREKGKSAIGYGILGLFIILSIWGLVNILVRTFGLNTNVPTDQIPGVIETNRNI